MTKSWYRDMKHKLRKNNRELLEAVIEITDEYAEQDLKMTLRQLYYQLFVRKIIKNEGKDYRRVSYVTTEGRMSGLIDWEVIEDRLRQPRIPQEFDSPKEIMYVAIDSYRKPRHEGQENYIEVWIEKDALSGVLAPIADEYHVTLMVNRGYYSTSAVHDSAERFLDAMNQGKKCVILYMGDHDPSGLDMVKDIQNRLDIFKVDVDVRIIAITKEQIEKYNLPPDEAKSDDPRFNGYILDHGAISWELDALPPEILNQILANALESVIEMEKYVGVVAEENEEKANMKRIIDQMDFEDD